MAKISRTVPAWTARAQTNTAKTTSTRNSRPRPGPEHILDEQRQAADDLAQLGAGRVADGQDRRDDQQRTGHAPRRPVPGGSPAGRGGEAGRSPRPACPPCRSRRARTRPSATRPGTARDSPRAAVPPPWPGLEQDARPAPDAARTAGRSAGPRPTSSAITPTLLIRASSRTPATLIDRRRGDQHAARGSRRCGRLSALTAGSPTSWKTGEICGSGPCSASATAASDRTEPHR